MMLFCPRGNRLRAFPPLAGRNRRGVAPSDGRWSGGAIDNLKGQCDPHPFPPHKGGGGANGAILKKRIMR